VRPTVVSCRASSAPVAPQRAPCVPAHYAARPSATPFARRTPPSAPESPAQYALFARRTCRFVRAARRASVRRAPSVPTHSWRVAQFASPQLPPRALSPQRCALSNSSPRSTLARRFTQTYPLSGHIPLLTARTSAAVRRMTLSCLRCLGCFVLAPWMFFSLSNPPIYMCRVVGEVGRSPPEPTPPATFPS